MAGYKIRMLTLHLDCQRLNDPAGAVEDYDSRLREAADRVYRELGLEVETTRITLDNCTVEEALDTVDALTASSPESLVSLGNYPVSPGAYELVASIAREGFFAALLMGDGWEQARAASRILHRLAAEDPSLATRVGVNVAGERIQTPYYPLSSTIDHGVLTVGLTYPNYLAEAYSRGGLEGLEDAVREAAYKAIEAARIASDTVGASPGGVDLSVAPWMRETSLGLVELVAGVRLPQPGLARGIALVNMVLRRVAGTLEATGFNEVQLPVAEDLKMKARVSELETRAIDLARLAGVCLAGLDLVVVPADEEGVAGLLLELRGYSVAKGRPLGARIVPVEDVEPGDRVVLDKFGETPVIPLA